jgi:hypothetical protein
LLVIVCTLQLSLVTGVPRLTVALLLLLLTVVLIFDGAVTDGFCVSVTVTIKFFVLVFPLTSFAVTVTVVVPVENTEPEFLLYVSVTGLPQLSLALATKLTVAPQTFRLLLTLMFEGTVITGAVLSCTVITWLAVLVLLLASFATHVRVMV